MLRHWVAAATPQRYGQSVAALHTMALLTAVALRVSLPVHPIMLEIPSTIGASPGAAPQESLAPRWTELPRSTSTPPLPSEAVRPEAAPSGETEVLPPSAIDAQRSAITTWSDRLPLAATGEGASNISRHVERPTMISTLVGSLLKSLQRIRTTALSPAKPAATVRRAPTSRPARSHATLTPSMATIAPLPIGGGRIGGPAPVRAVLGGAVAATAYHAPVIGGPSTHSYR